MSQRSNISQQAEKSATPLQNNCKLELRLNPVCTAVTHCLQADLSWWHHLDVLCSYDMKNKMLQEETSKKTAGGITQSPCLRTTDAVSPNTAGTSSTYFARFSGRVPKVSRKKNNHVGGGKKKSFLARLAQPPSSSSCSRAVNIPWKRRRCFCDCCSYCSALPFSLQFKSARRIWVMLLLCWHDMLIVSKMKLF